MPNPLTFPCSKRRTCPGVDLPIDNYSAEGAELGPPFWAVAFPEPPNDPPREFFQKMGCLFMCTSWNSQAEVDACIAAQTPFCDEPPPGFFYAWGCKTVCISSISQADADACAEAQLSHCQDEVPVWQAQGCVSLCTSYISQEDANLCALRQASQCVNGSDGGGGGNDGTGGGGGSDPQCNEEQSCSYTLADGTVFTYTVPAGTFCDQTVAVANAQALAYACNQSSNPEVAIALSDLITSCCKNGDFSKHISLTQNSQNGDWTLSGGALPNGMTLHAGSGDSVLLDGQPTGLGDFSFTVRFTTPSGHIAERTYALQVQDCGSGGCSLQITTAALPNGQVGAAYSTSLAATGSTETFIWSVSGGALPPGLSLGTNGAITGTPTTAGTYSFTAQVTDLNCSVTKDLAITITSPGTYPTASVLMARRSGTSGGDITVGVFGSSYFLTSHVGQSVNGLLYGFYDGASIFDVDPLDGYGADAEGVFGTIPFGVPRLAHGAINTSGPVLGSVSADLDVGSTPSWPATLTIAAASLAALQAKQPTLTATLNFDIMRVSSYRSTDLSVHVMDGHTISFQWFSGGYHEAVYKRHDCSTVPAGVFYFTDGEDFGLAQITLT